MGWPSTSLLHLKGEEWRIGASKLLYGGFGKIGAWNETLERLEGVLFGYDDWQNDWWMEYVTAKGGRFRGLSLCCAVDAAGLAWMASAGFRALPPIENPTLNVTSFDPYDEIGMRDFMSETPSSAALVRFNVLGRFLVDIFDFRHGGPWTVPGHRIPELNRHLRGSVIIAARRDDPLAAAQDP